MEVNLSKCSNQMDHFTGEELQVEFIEDSEENSLSD
jgi:hypothetical protein